MLTATRPVPMPRLAGCLCACAVLAPLVAAAAWTFGAETTSAVPLAAVLLGIWTAASLLMVLTLPYHPHRKYGPANALTAFRAAASVALLGPALDPGLAEGTGRWLVLGLAAAALALDGIDGWLARRTGLVSAYGARFDMEVDAAHTLVLSALAWRAGMAGPEILALVAPYYLFSASRALLPWLADPLPPARYRKLVCVLQVALPIGLLALTPPLVVARVLTILTLAAILVSFARDVRHLHGRRR